MLDMPENPAACWPPAPAGSRELETKMAGKFTKVLFAVELDGKPYGVELESDKLQQLLHRAAELSPDGQLSLSPMPNQQMFEVVMRKTSAAAKTH